jgi:SAM-dependent methyltransferase
VVDDKSIKGRREAWDRAYSEEGILWRRAAQLNLEIPLHCKVLELGCGNGKTLEALLSKSDNVIAIDHSRSCLEICSKMMKRRQVGLVQADVQCLPFRDGAFGVVMCHHILEHLYAGERETAARDISRIISPEGKLFFEGFSVLDMRNGMGEEVEPRTFVRGNGINTHYFVDSEVEGLFPDMELNSLTHRTFTKNYGGSPKVRDTILATFIK